MSGPCLYGTEGTICCNYLTAFSANELVPTLSGLLRHLLLCNCERSLSDGNPNAEHPVKEARLYFILGEIGGAIRHAGCNLRTNNVQKM
jgi:hypothetical protein